MNLSFPDLQIEHISLGLKEFFFFLQDVIEHFHKGQFSSNMIHTTLD